MLDGRDVVLTLKGKVAGPHNTRMQSEGISLTQTTKYAGGQSWHYSETRDKRLINALQCLWVTLEILKDSRQKSALIAGATTWHF